MKTENRKCVKVVAFKTALKANIFFWKHDYLLRASKTKELSLCHKLKFSNPYIFATFDISNLDYLIQ